MAVVSRLARDLIGVVVPEGRDGSVGVGSRGDVVDAVVAILVVRQSDACAGFMQDDGRAVRRIVGIRDSAAVGVDLPGHPVGVVVAEGRRLGVGLGGGGQPTDCVVGVAPTPGSCQLSSPSSGFRH